MEGNFGGDVEVNGVAAAQSHAVAGVGHREVASRLQFRGLDGEDFLGRLGLDFKPAKPSRQP